MALFAQMGKNRVRVNNIEHPVTIITGRIQAAWRNVDIRKRSTAYFEGNSQRVAAIKPCGVQFFFRTHQPQHSSPAATEIQYSQFAKFIGNSSGVLVFKQMIEKPGCLSKGIVKTSSDKAFLNLLGRIMKTQIVEIG